MEGTLCFSPPSNCNTAGLILPIHEYGRDDGSVIVGGYFYRGAAIPSLWGKYIFADFRSRRLWALSEGLVGWQRQELLNTDFSISSLGEDENGELYVVDYLGSVRQIFDTDVPQPVVNEGGVVNAASFLSGPVAAGEIVSIFGSGIGPNQ